LITGCIYNNVIDSNYYCERLNISCIKNNRRVSFKTSKGDFDVKLYGKNNPVTANNFIKNIKKNIYKNIRFYKIINFPQVQVIYSGIYSENNHYKNENQNLNKFRLNIPLEIKFKKEIEPKYRYQIEDPSQIVKLANIFEKGSLAMVKSGDRNSSSTEFFLVTNKFPELDGRYSIFGKVVKGIEILDKLEKEDLIYEITISN
tara:strand:- start:159 stop:764 length:606 start_codon:yes stop_codon:yes gene_type:complete